MPAFMPVGTQATVKGLTVDMVRATGAEMVLGNTYHLALRPGAEVSQQLGGLHAFMGWDGPDPDRQRRFSALQPRTAQSRQRRGGRVSVRTSTAAG